MTIPAVVHLKTGSSVDVSLRAVTGTIRFINHEQLSRAFHEGQKVNIIIVPAEPLSDELVIVHETDLKLSGD